MQMVPLLDFITRNNTTGLSQSDFLKKIATHHPYFTPAQFYVLQQLNDTEATYNQQAAKTALLFNNSYWLQFQLQHGIISTNTFTDEMEMAETNMPAENSDNDDDISSIAAPVTANETPAVTTSIETTPLTEAQLSSADNTDNDDDATAEIAPVKITLPDMKSQPDTTEALTFEPMHLVDYFASQGIKLSDDVQNADKLGKQLKSFTEWLKTMKKIHTADTEANAVVSDIAVQALAAKSNKEGEVVTETMAEVLLQQGKAGKAIEVYQKLSLLNPDKRAFFAAKIEQLKGS